MNATSWSCSMVRTCVAPSSYHHYLSFSSGSNFLDHFSQGSIITVSAFLSNCKYLYFLSFVVAMFVFVHQVFVFLSKLLSSRELVCRCEVPYQNRMDYWNGLSFV
jgi:hypothetical protein